MGCSGSKDPARHFVVRDTPEGQGEEVLTLCDLLGLSRADLDKLWVCFQSLDADKGGAISLDEFIVLCELDICESYARQVFRIFDSDGSGEINFAEWLQAVWALCSSNPELLAHFSFTLLDLDNNCALSGHEIGFMASLLHDFNPSDNAKIAVQHFLDKMEKDEVSEVTLEEYMAEIKKSEVLLMPATEMAIQLMKKTLGISTWQKYQNKRISDYGSKTLFEILGVSANEELQMKVRGLSHVKVPGGDSVLSKSVRKKMDRARALRDAELAKNKKDVSKAKWDEDYNSRHEHDLRRELNPGGKAAAASKGHSAEHAHSHHQHPGVDNVKAHQPHAHAPHHHTPSQSTPSATPHVSPHNTPRGGAHGHAHTHAHGHGHDHHKPGHGHGHAKHGAVVPSH